MQRKLLFLFTILGLMLVPLIAVSAQDDAVIGVVLPNTTGDFFAGVIAGAEATAETLEVQLVILDSNNDLETEAANVAALIEQGAAAILISPIDAVESLAAVEAANEAGIPVFALGDSFELSESEVEIASTVGLDNAAAGEAAAEYLCESLSRAGVVVEIARTYEVEEGEELSTLAAIAQERSAGFNSAIEAGCDGVSVTRVDVTDLSDSEIVAQLQGILADGGANAIFATNDTDILLAMRATIRARATGIVLVGFNATEDTLGAIQLGRLTGIVAPLASQVGSLAVEAALAFLGGEEVAPNLFADVMLVNDETLIAVRGNCPRGVRCQ